MSQLAPPPDTAVVAVRDGQEAVSRPRPGDDALQAPTPLSPTMVRLTVGTVAGGALYGSAGAVVGSLEDESRCRRNHPGDRSGFFSDYCSLVFGDATRTGWLVGTFVGATTFAVIGAHRRGCPIHAALWRAGAGTVLGMVPTIITAATPSKSTPAPRSMMFASGPLFGGAVAALAVRSCHR
jgi:hypothetical protein